MSAGRRVHLVVMGVSGCGKTTLGEGVARETRRPFADADHFHPPANVAKMAAGIPLDDEDRRPWLAALAGWLAEQDAAGRASVLAGSMLKRAYRDVLRSAVPALFFVHLDGDREVLRERLAGRSGHFFPPSLLDSQIAALEPLGSDELGATLDIALAPAEQRRRAVEAIDGRQMGDARAGGPPATL